MSTKHENSVQLVGEITNDIFTRQGITNDKGWNMASFSLLTEIPTKKGSTKTFHNISSFNEIADKLKGISKGATIKVIGSIENRKYNDKNGVEVKTTQISASLIEVLSVPNAEKSLGNRDSFLTDDLEDESNNLPV